MAKSEINDMLKRRMIATQQASELQASDNAYQKIFQQEAPTKAAELCELPLDKLIPFYTAKIGFRPYPPAKLEALAEQLQEDGLFVRIIARETCTGEYEILSGHNRVSAAKLAGWGSIPAEVVEADDTRAIVIATSTNLIQRQGLTIIERGLAYKALLDAKNRHGQWYIESSETFGENRQKFDKPKPDGHPRYNARKLVAEFFGVTEYEIRKAIKLTYLIPELVYILENDPKQLNLACADMMADYDAESQKAFIEMCSIEGYPINKSAMQHITRKCPPPTASQQEMYAAWRETRDMAEKRLTAPPKNITFNRKKFAPYLDKLGNDRELEKLFLEFLQEKMNVS